MHRKTSILFHVMQICSQAALLPSQNTFGFVQLISSCVQHFAFLQQDPFSCAMARFGSTIFICKPVL